MSFFYAVFTKIRKRLRNSNLSYCCNKANNQYFHEKAVTLGDRKLLTVIIGGCYDLFVNVYANDCESEKVR